MTERSVVLVGGLGLLAVAALGLLAGALGGVTIRSASRTHVVRNLRVSTTTLVPGVPVNLAVTGGALSGEAVIVLRGPTSTFPVRVVPAPEVQRGLFTARIPCDLPAAGMAAETRLLLLDERRGTVLAQSRQLKLLSPGPDCALLK